MRSFLDVAAPIRPKVEDDPTIERVQPERPLTEIVQEFAGEGGVTDIVQFLIEPALQVLLILTVATAAKYVSNKVIARVVTRLRRQSFGLRLGRRAPSSGRRATRADAVGAVLRSAANVVIVAVSVFMVLGVFGIDLAPLFAGAGIIGLAVGFGAQDLVADFIAGVFMLAEDQYGVGDFIDVGDGVVGEVEAMSLRTTRIRDLEGTLWHVPNGEIRRTGNMSQGWGRVVLDVSVASHTDVDQAAEIMENVARHMASEPPYDRDFRADPEIWGVQALSAGSIDIRLVAVTRPATQWALTRELRRRIKPALETAGIEIPLPQRSVWLRSEDGKQDLMLPRKHSRERIQA